LHRTVAACLAAILEIDAGTVPLPEEGHPDPWTPWRNWLGQRALGLVPIAEPAGFSWPGPWLALLRASDGDGRVAAVAFGSPPGIAWHPLGGPEDFDALEAGYLVAPADVALWTPAERAATPGPGTVEAIVVAADAEAPMARVERAGAHAGRGLEGDRYHAGRGTFTNAHGRGHDLTLIAMEDLEELGLTPEDARRNVATRGIDLTALVGRAFRVGGVECLGQRLCEPCAHLERLAPGMLRPLIHKGGLRADIVSDGEIRVGDVIELLTE
jgi:MOSC domain-containing protein YiiM